MRKICARLLILFLFGLWFFANSPSVYAWEFAVIGDTRSGHEVHQKNIAGIIAKMPNNERITVLNTGDLTQSSEDKDWKKWQEEISPLNINWDKKDPPQYIATVGQKHDTAAGQSGWENIWAKYLPAQVKLSAYSGIDGHSHGVYGSAKYQNAIFIWISSANDLPSGGGFTDKQNIFLENTLEKASQDPAVQWKFVFFHNPPAPCGTKNDSSKGRKFMDNYLIPNKVDVLFLGHAHYYNRTCPITEVVSKNCDPDNRGNIINQETNGVVNIIVGGGAAGLYDTDCIGDFSAPDKTCPNCKWIEAAYKKYHFMEIEVDPNFLNIKAWNTSDGSADNPVLMDELTINSSGGPDITPTSTIKPSHTPIPTAIPTQSPKNPDLNGDGEVGGKDVKRLLPLWGEALSLSIPEDLDSNLWINSLDVAYIFVSWTGVL